VRYESTPASSNHSISCLQSFRGGGQLKTRFVRSESWSLEVTRICETNWLVPGRLKTVTRSWLRSAVDVPVVADVEQPQRVGIDRLLNAWAARHWRRAARPVIVVDSGTATTVDLITQDGVFRGGSILPGLRLSARALHEYTARLPLLDVDDAAAGWPSVPGRNTEAAIRAGLLVGQLGAVKELAARLTEAARIHYGDECDPELFVTGGGGRLLAQHLPGAVYVDSLAPAWLALLGWTLQSGMLQS
jgi:type III pantothenate kinase